MPSTLDNPPKAALIGAFLASAATISYVVKSYNKWERTSGLSSIQLLPSESSPIIRSAPPISSVTFCTGDWQDAEKQLRLKVRRGVGLHEAVSAT